jgi:hypothetical protein
MKIYLNFGHSKIPHCNLAMIFKGIIAHKHLLFHVTTHII